MEIHTACPSLPQRDSFSWLPRAAAESAWVSWESRLKSWRKLDRICEKCPEKSNCEIDSREASCNYFLLRDNFSSVSRLIILSQIFMLANLTISRQQKKRYNKSLNLKNLVTHLWSKYFYFVSCYFPSHNCFFRSKEDIL